MTALTIGIDIGGTKVAAGIVTPANAVMVRRECATPAADGPDAVLDAAAELAGELLASAPAGDAVHAVGVGSAGAIDSGSRTVVAATDHIRGWTGTDIGGILEARLSLPVAVDNDARAHAVGEAVAGAGYGYGTVVLAAVGTGIGGAVVVGGSPLGGAHGIAGHLGHIPVAEASGMPCPCGLTGHLESISSGGGLVALYRSRSGRQAVTSADAVVSAAATDPVAADCVELSAGTLGRVLAGVAALIDPDVLIISGGLQNAGALWWQAVRSAFATTVYPLLTATPLVPARLGVDAAIIGAAHLARSRAVRP